MKEITKIEELKKIELEIMRHIHFFCEDNSINYFLAAGTLIGAVRHRGFIPWDDDIDILMYREDHNRFLSLFPQYGKDHNLMAVNPYTKPYYGRPMTKVIDTRTTLIEEGFGCDDPIGVFVDIWIMDNVPGGEEKIKWLKKMRHERNKLFAASYALSKNYSIQKNMGILLGRMVNQKKQAIRFDTLSQKYNDTKSDEVACYLGMTSKLEVYKKEWFEDRILMNFETERFYVPLGYDSWLINRYGNYTQLPPESERVPHHIANIYWKEGEQ